MVNRKKRSLRKSNERVGAGTKESVTKRRNYPACRPAKK